MYCFGIYLLLYILHREEDSLISIFIVEMLCVMLHSLKLAHKDDAALGMSLLWFIVSVDTQGCLHIVEAS